MESSFFHHVNFLKEQILLEIQEVRDTILTVIQDNYSNVNQNEENQEPNIHNTNLSTQDEI